MLKIHQLEGSKTHQLKSSKKTHEKTFPGVLISVSVIEKCDVCAQIVSNFSHAGLKA